MWTRHIVGVGVVLTLVVAAGAIMRGQTPAGAATLDDLLREIQGLRADLARSSNTAVRVQVLTARLSLEEQRVNDAGRALAAAQARLSDTQDKLSAAQIALESMDAAVRTNSLSSQQQQDVQGVLPSKRVEVTNLETSEQALRAEVTRLTNLVADEQNQWTNFNNQLDDLERSLAATR